MNKIHSDMLGQFLESGEEQRSARGAPDKAAVRLAAAELGMTSMGVAETGPEGRRSLIVLCGFLFLTRLPYFRTEHIQEDAFITFRTAFNLADHGTLTFNLGEHYAPTTSLLYAFLVAAVRVVAGHMTIPIVLALNALAAIAAIILVGYSFELRGRSLWAFSLLVSLMAGALVASYNGMETSWYLLFIAALIWCLGRPLAARWVFFCLITISPLVRPDGLVLAASAAALQWVFGTTAIRHNTRWNLVALLNAVVAYVTLNLVTSHTWVTPSLIAKQAAYHPALSLHAIALRFVSTYFFGPLSLIPSTKYTPWQLACGLSLLLLTSVALGLLRLHSRLPRLKFAQLCYLGFVASVFPLLFVVAGGMFPWYFLPSQFTLASCVLVELFLLTTLKSRRYCLMLICPAIVATAALQFVVSLNIGRQESGYRASVGRYLALVADPGDTLILEPAGYIPFYSGLTTYDEVGLTSPQVLPYLRSHQRNWIAQFIHDVCATFTVQRGDFADGYLTGTGYKFNDAEQQWFSEHYETARRFHYDPAEWARNAVELPILKFGSHSDYIVYRRRASVDCGSVAVEGSQK